MKTKIVELLEVCCYIPIAVLGLIGLATVLVGVFCK